jgi:RHS repeat-associated protein
MSNERSLSARKTHADILPVLLRSNRWVLALLALSIVVHATPLRAQGTCPPVQVMGDILTGDGSVPAAGSLVWLNTIPGHINTYEYPPWPGAATKTLFPFVPPYGHGSISYVFEAQTSNYLSALQGGSATCYQDPQQCIHCSGGFSFKFYSVSGNVTGKITYTPDGAPAEGATAGVTHAPLAPSLPANSAGFYTFDRTPLPIENHDGIGGLQWAPGANSGPGFREVDVFATANASDPTKIKTVTVTSNRDSVADFEIPRPGGAETEPRCNSGSESQPGPSANSQSVPPPKAPTPACTVGCPVSVTTGNVDVDQTDTVVPGLGLGLRFSRSYNSANSAVPERYGVFGRGWNHSYEKRLTFPWDGSIKLRNSDGTITYFSESGEPETEGTYEQTAPWSKDSHIVKDPNSNLYVRHFLRGGQEVYDRLTPGGTSARLTSLADAVGNTTLLTYTGNKLTSIADPGGRQLTLGYTGDQLTALCSSTSPISCGTGSAGLIATFAYTSGTSPRLSGVTYADGDGDTEADGSYTFAYHAAGNGAEKLWKVTDGSGRVTETHDYYPDGRAWHTSISDNVRKYTLAYQADRTVVTDSLGNDTTYHWQQIAGVQRITQTDGSCSACGGGGNATEYWGYDEKGRVISHTDGEGNLTEYTYDDDGNLALIQAPVMEVGPRHTTEMNYDTTGRLVSRIAPNLATTTWTYVAAGPETITEEVSSGVTRTTTLVYYTAARSKGKLRYSRDPLNRQTQFNYSDQGDLVMVTDPSGHSTTFQYDLMGRRTKTVPPATTPPSDTPTTSYDTLGRVWKVTNPNGSYWKNTYDGGGRRTVARDPAGHLTNYVYDTYGRLSTVTNLAVTAPPAPPTDYVTEYRYDEMSNLRYLIDPRQYPQPSPPNTATEFRYEDGHNRVTEVIYPGNLREEFTYDLAGRLATRTDRKGVETTLTYDALGRLVSKTYSDGSAPVTFEYDGGDDTGFLTGASNSADTLGWDYDGAGQMLSESSARNATTVSYQYFLSGQRQKVRLNGSDVLTYAYQTDSQLDTITRAAGVVFDFNPDPAHRRQNVVFPNGTTTEYGYDLLSRLSLIRLKRGATVLNDIAYESNDLNNRTSRTENGTRLQYGYDDLSRLLTVNRTLPTVALLEQYGYDKVGNRETALGVPGTWSYNDRNELTSYNGINFTYDLNGNQLTRSGTPSRTNTWDVENKLTAVTDGGVTKAQFEYDPLGRRVAKTVPGVGLTRFAYDGEDILFEQGPSGNFTYLHGPGIDEPLARETSTGVRTYYHADGLGSIVKRTDAAGIVIGTQTYDSFGVGAGLAAGYSYTGREWDEETALHFYRARHYEPTLGRFLSSDPIGFDGGLNFYAYVLANPTNWTDPFGLDVNVCYYSDAAYGFGHVGFGLPGETGTTGYYSDGIREDNQQDERCKVVPASPDQDQCMLECRNERQQNPGEYKLLKRQCTSFVRDCLRQCGLDGGGYNGPRPFPFFDDLPFEESN